MDEFSIFVADDPPETSAPEAASQSTRSRDLSDPEDAHHSESELQSPPSRGIRGRVAAIRDKANFQDRLLER
jgi:hypothetical protein